MPRDKSLSRRRRPVRRSHGISARLAIALVAVVAAAGAGALWLFAGSAPAPAAGFAGANGAPAPAFQLPTVDGRTVSLGDFEGKRNVLLFFNMGVG